MMPFILHEDSTLRGFLSHIRSLAVQTAGLHFAMLHHPDVTSEHLEKLAVSNPVIKEKWDSIRADLMKLIEVDIVPYNQLCESADIVAWQGRPHVDPLMISMKHLKQKADKARLKDPTITMLRSQLRTRREAYPDSFN